MKKRKATTESSSDGVGDDTATAAVTADDLLGSTVVAETIVDGVLGGLLGKSSPKLSSMSDIEKATQAVTTLEGLVKFSADLKTLAEKKINETKLQMNVCEKCEEKKEGPPSSSSRSVVGLCADCQVAICKECQFTCACDDATLMCEDCISTCHFDNGLDGDVGCGQYVCKTCWTTTPCDRSDVGGCEECCEEFDCLDCDQCNGYY